MPDENKITSEELVDKIVEKFEQRQKEKVEKEKKDAEDQAKIKSEALENAVKSLDMEKVAEMVADKIKAIPAAESSQKADTNNPHFTTATNVNKIKLKKDEQDLLDAIKSKGTQELTFKFDLYEGEDRLLHMLKKGGREGVKANLDGASSYGADLLPESWGTELYMRLASAHGNLASYVRKVPMSAYKHHISELLPAITVSAYSTYSNQTTAIENVTASASTTADLTLTAKKFVAKCNIYNQLNDDTIVNLMRGVKIQMADKFSEKQTAACLNGDTTTTHMDEDLAAQSNIPEKMWKGWRKLIMAGGLGVDGTDAAYTLADLISLKTLMGKYALGSQRNFCKWIFGVQAYNKLVGLLLAQTAAPQMADYTIKEGEVNMLLGCEVLTSDQQREDLETDGYADSTGTDGNQGFISLVNMNEFVMGMRQEVMIKIVPDDLNDRKVMMGTMMGDFAAFEAPSTTISTCAGLYGFTN